jgi:hypothetical protein
METASMHPAIGISAFLSHIPHAAESTMTDKVSVTMYWTQRTGEYSSSSSAFKYHDENHAQTTLLMNATALIVQRVPWIWRESVRDSGTPSYVLIVGASYK